MMMERILKQRQPQWCSKHKIGERMTGQKRTYGGDGEEWEEVYSISFHLITRFNCDVVNYVPPHPLLDLEYNLNDND